MVEGVRVADQSDAQLVRDAYAAFIKGDMETFGKTVADGIATHFPGRNPLAGDRHSKAEFFEMLGQIAEQTLGTFRLEVRDIAGGDEHVVALVEFGGERNGKTLSGEGVQVWRVESGKIVEGLFLSNDVYATDEFWS
jgi:uncharacterized protein